MYTYSHAIHLLHFFKNTLPILFRLYTLTPQQALEACRLVLYRLSRSQRLAMSLGSLAQLAMS